MLKEIVGYGRATERDRQKLVMEYRQQEAGFLLVAAILLAGLVVGLAWLSDRDSQGFKMAPAKEELSESSKQERSKRAGTRFVMNKEEWIR